jgi:hypothetical protein
LDFRQKPDLARGGDRAEGIDARPFYGMEFLLIRSHKEDSEDLHDGEPAATVGKIAVASLADPRLGRVEISAIPLRRNIPGWLAKSNNRVFHAVNGQVQFKRTRGYLSQTCGFPALKDRVVILVDASNLTFEAHNDVWKGDRENIRNTIVGERYQELVTTAIRESQVLKDLHFEVIKEELSDTASSQRNELFQKLLDTDGNLAGLLSNRVLHVDVPIKKKNETGRALFEGKFSPTFLKFGSNDRIRGVDIPFDRGRAVTAHTDAENGYLQRPINRGEIVVDRRIRERFGMRTHLHNGQLMIYLEPMKGAVRIGDKFKFRIGLHDGSMGRRIQAHLTLNVTARQQEDAPAGKKPAARTVPTNELRSKSTRIADRLPKYKLLTKDGRNIGGQPTERWMDGFNEHDGGTVQEKGKNEIVYKINYDNAYHLKYRLQQKGDVARDIVTQKYILGMRILMLGFERAYRSGIKRLNGRGADLARSINEFRLLAARGAGSTVLTLAENLPKIIDKVAATDTQNVE